MSLCVCRHPSEKHWQYDEGEACMDCSCDRYRKAADSHESTAFLSAGGSPEGLARETVAESVNVMTPPTDEARATCTVRPTGQEWREPCGYPMPCRVHGDEARADYPPMPECDHAQDCICVEPDHAYCCGTARAAVLDSMTDHTPALDVERLAEALRDSGVRTMLGDARATARKVAAEYARLSEKEG